jgi:TatD DNase family protein
MIDTHTHLYDEAFDADRAEVIQRARTAGVQKMILPAIDSTSHQRLIDVFQQYPQVLVPCMGLHPTSVNTDYRSELDKVAAHLADNAIPWVAVGEIGLDYYWSKEYKVQQQDALVVQLRWASEMNLPVIVHCREAMGDILQLMEGLNLNMKGVFHAYSGSVESYKRIKQLGDFKLGIGGVLTYKKSLLPEVLSHVAMDDIVLETDAPYLTPVPFRGYRNESSYLPYIVQKISEIYASPVEQIVLKTNQNVVNIFGKMFVNQ